MHSYQVRKYSISESIIQALYYDIVGNSHNKGLYYGFRDAILSIIWSLCIKRWVHHDIYCIS